MSKYSDIATFGCSFLTNAYDYEPEAIHRTGEAYRGKPMEWYNQRSFPELLRKKANIPVKNYAKPSHSIDFSLRKAYSHITNRDKSQGKGLVIIALTSLARTEYRAPFCLEYQHVTPSDCHLHHPRYTDCFKAYLSKEKFREIVSDNYKYFYNEDLRIEELKASLNMLHAYGKSMNVDLIVFFSFTGSTKNLKHFSKAFFSDTNLFDFFNFGFKKDTLVTWTDFIRSYDSSYHGGHPFFIDNKILAELMHDYIYSERSNSLKSFVRINTYPSKNYKSINTDNLI